MRNKLARTALLVATAIAPCAMAQGEPRLITLEQAQKQAIERHFGAKAKRLAVDEARARIGQADSRFLPRLGVAAGFEGEAARERAESGGFGYLYGSYNLFNGFRDRYQLRVAELEADQATADVQAAELAIALEVEDSFVEVLYRRELVALKAREVARNDGHRELVRRSRALGSIAETDVMEFDLAAARLESEKWALEQELANARGSLRLLLGDTGDSGADPTGELAHGHVKGEADRYAAMLTQTGAAVKAAANAAAIAREEKDAAEARWLPQIDLETRFGLLPRGEGLEGRRPQGSVVVAARMDLYTGRSASWEAREKAASAAKREAELQQRMSEDKRAIEVGLQSLRLIERQADLERGMLAGAQRYYAGILAEYNRGAKNSLDLKSASEQWAEVERRRVTLDFELAKTRLGVEKVLGARLEIDSTEPPASPAERGRP